MRFQLNQVQQLYNRSKTNRDLILKARQEGFTSFILALFTIDCLHRPHTRSVVISHDKDATQRLLMKVKNYIRRFANGDEIVTIDMNLDNKDEILFAETGSTFYIGTAGASKRFGRGDTIHNLLLSEYAFYENPDELLTGIQQSVPKDGRIIIETTANGYNDFRTLWYNSKDGKTAFTPHFFPWYVHGEYTLPGELPADQKTAEELEMQQKHPEITDGNVLWRREKMREFANNPHLFNQEYPTDDHDAFVASGSAVFNTDALQWYAGQTKPPIFHGNVDEKGQISSDSRGFLKLWAFKDPQKSYLVGGDVAEGLSTGDYCSAHVIEYETGNMVATWHGHVDPDQFGAVLVGLGRYYNGATVGCESNNHGFTTNLAMKRLGYSAIYARITYDTVTQRQTEQLGWRTDAKTKPVMVGDLKALVRERAIVIPDEQTIRELFAFQESEPVSSVSSHRRLGAASGEHDDRVISLAIALQMRKLVGAPVMQNQPAVSSYRQSSLAHARPRTTYTSI